MRIKLVAIGNSKGIRLPKALIAESGLMDDVELELKHGGLLLRPVKRARDGWDQAFARMRKRNDDELIDSASAVSSAFDRKEWTW